VNARFAARCEKVSCSSCWNVRHCLEVFCFVVCQAKHNWEPSGRPLTTSSLIFLVLAAAILNSVNAPHTALLVVAAMQFSLQHQPSLRDTAGFCSHLHPLSLLTSIPTSFILFQGTQTPRLSSPPPTTPLTSATVHSRCCLLYMCQAQPHARAAAWPEKRNFSASCCSFLQHTTTNLLPIV
jgi:hypothetical protein